MKVIIAGSRDINDMNLLTKAIEDSGFQITEVVSGGATGVDRLGENWSAWEFTSKPGIQKLTRFPADWNSYGKAAGPIRNKQMAEYADAAIVIHNGSKGSLNMISQMKKLNKPVHEVKI